MADTALATLETANEAAGTYGVSVRGPFKNYVRTEGDGVTKETDVVREIA